MAISDGWGGLAAAAIPAIGALSRVPVIDPSNGAPPNAKVPPSALPTRSPFRPGWRRSQKWGLLGGGW